MAARQGVTAMPPVGDSFQFLSLLAVGLQDQLKFRGHQNRPKMSFPSDHTFAIAVDPCVQGHIPTSEKCRFQIGKRGPELAQVFNSVDFTSLRCPLMTSIPPITVKEHLCCRKEEVLAELAATQARSAPTLFRNFVITVLPQLLPDDWKNSSHLKKITPHNPLVTVRSHGRLLCPSRLPLRPSDL